MINTSILNKFGTVAGWNKVTARVLGRDVVGISSIEYDDNVDMENIRGAGGMPVGQGEGDYEAKASITLLQEERVNLLDALPPGTRIQDIPAFDIVIAYEYNDKIRTDVIRNCRFKNSGVSVNQGDKSISFKHELLTSHIEWNV